MSVEDFGLAGLYSKRNRTQRRVNLHRLIIEGTDANITFFDLLLNNAFRIRKNLLEKPGDLHD